MDLTKSGSIVWISQGQPKQKTGPGTMKKILPYFLISRMIGKLCQSNYSLPGIAGKKLSVCPVHICVIML